jgi:hypothetical protein
VMPAEYFETQFESEQPWSNLPAEFAIITAYATTGEVWPDEVNQAADARLESELRDRCTWVQRITGYSPTTSHSEPGWAVQVGFEEACDIGLRYKQDAIYFVSGSDLSVSFCDGRRGLVHVGDFWARFNLEAQ